MRWKLKTRRGMTAVLAMMYLALFSTLALGFYASVTTSAQISGNDRRGTEGRLAAESGMQFIKYHLAEMDIPKTTKPSQILKATYDQLCTRVNPTTNLHGKPVGIFPNETNPAYVAVPGADNAFIFVDEHGMEFRAIIERNGDWGLRVTTSGRVNPKREVTTSLRGARGVQVDFANKTEPGTLFSYGLASKSAITMQGNVKLLGGAGDLRLASLLSTSNAVTPVTLLDGATISGDLTTTGGLPVVAPTAKVGNVTPLDPSYASHLHTLPAGSVPDFPMIETSQYLAFASLPDSPGELATASPPAGTYRNLRIPAGLNPVFSGGGTILEGVTVIEYPNQVKFVSSCEIKGVIVSECTASDNNHQARVDVDMAANGVMDNWVHFGGQVTSVGVEALDPDVFPQALRDLTGSLIVIPGFQATFRGGSGTIGGAIVASGFDWAGNTGGTLNGSIINVANNVPVKMAGNNTMTITGHGDGSPAGIRFVSHFAPAVNSYREVHPR